MRSSSTLAAGRVVPIRDGTHTGVIVLKVTCNLTTRVASVPVSARTSGTSRTNSPVLAIGMVLVSVLVVLLVLEHSSLVLCHSRSVTYVSTVVHPVYSSVCISHSLSKHCKTPPEAAPKQQSSIPAT